MLEDRLPEQSRQSCAVSGLPGRGELEQSGARGKKDEPLAMFMTGRPLGVTQLAGYCVHL